MAAPNMETTERTTVLIERSSYFHGQLHLVGYAFSWPSPIREIAVCLADGRRLPMVCQPSPDLAGRFGASAVAARFNAILPVGADIGAVLEGELVATRTDGSTIVHQLCKEDSSDVTGGLLAQFTSRIAAMPAGHMLEIGSRERTGANYRGLLPQGWDYLGFDILDGPNVDVVGDAHEASSFLPHDHFDAVMSFAVFEHLLMPWKAVLEMNKVLKPGAIGLILAPQTWPLHEEPWDYFRFSRHAWKGLLNPATGFEIIAAADGGTTFVVPASLTRGSAFGEWHTGAMMSGVLFRKTASTPLVWPVTVGDVVDDVYPA